MTEVIAILPLEGVQSMVMSVCLGLCASACISQKPQGQTSHFCAC